MNTNYYLLILVSLITLLNLFKVEYRYQTRKITKIEYILSFLSITLTYSVISIILYP